MKLTNKQEEIKTKILAGTHVLYADVEKKKAINLLRSIKKQRSYGIGTYNGLYEERDNFGVDELGMLIYVGEKQINDRPIINMSEWFEEAECSFTTSNGKPQIVIEVQEESTKDMREYDEQLLKDYNFFVIKNDLEEHLPRARKEFINRRYPNEALLKEKAEIEARLKEIEEQLGCDLCNEDGWIVENKGDVIVRRLCKCDKAK